MAESVPSKKELFQHVAAPSGIEVDRGVALKACALCGGKSVRRLYMQAHFPVVRCCKCGLIYADEHFRDADLQAFYSGDYYQRAYVCHPKEIDRKIANGYVAAFDRIDRHMRGGSLLDFGSARGTFLSELVKRGYTQRWRCEGIDINPDEVAMGRAAGLDLRCARLEESGIAPGTYDAVTAFSVVEHLQDPIGILRGLRDVLRPGGRILVHVPSGECLIVRAALLASKLFGQRTRGFTDSVFHEEHLYYFTPRTLTEAFELAGLRPIGFGFEPSYLETHPTSPLVALGAYGLRGLSFLTRRQTMLFGIAERVG
ncbi:MAG: methyltransferase domain-containing protein [Planctomycetes bacterium]|nr:methyltransferase domain-containing protein [Planctomycetota bacterium]